MNDAVHEAQWDAHASHAGAPCANRAQITGGTTCALGGRRYLRWGCRQSGEVLKTFVLRRDGRPGPDPLLTFAAFSQVAAVQRLLLLVLTARLTDISHL